MPQHTLARTSLAAAALLLLGACASDPAAPPPAGPSLATSGGSPALVSALTREAPLAQAITATATIGKSGGSFAIPEAGLRVVVPKGAVRASTTFTATALAGDLVAYEFGPHGAVFGAPLRVMQDLKGTTWYKLADRSTMEAGYFASEAQLDDETDQAYVEEFVPTVVDVSGAKLYFAVEHFSGYMVSSGRKER